MRGYIAIGLAVGGVLSGGFMFATGLAQFLEGVTAPGDVADRRDEDLEMPDSLGGYLGKVIGGGDASKIGDFVEASVYMMDAAHNLGPVGAILKKVLTAEFIDTLVEFAESAKDGLSGDSQ
jgi:hypothetical protein